MVQHNIIKHSFTDTVPNGSDLAVGELAIQITNSKAKLFTKDFTGEVITIGEGAKYLSDLLDVSLVNAKEGSFLVKQGDKFVASNFIGSLTNLTDIEISNPTSGDYLRYDPLFGSFRNFKPSYGLWQLTNVTLPDPTNSTSYLGLDNQTLVYNHTLGKFVTRTRVNQLKLLDDVQIVQDPLKYEFIVYDSPLNKWVNKPLEIKWDTTPELGGHLNANLFNINNSTYRVKNLVADTALLDCNYTQGDYFVIEGVTSAVRNQCIIQPIFSSGANSTSVMMLEIRQSTGLLLIGGLSNIKYEDGKPPVLSGAGKVDLVTITNVNTPSGVTNYITIAAMNLATLGNGGIPAYRYDKNRYPPVQYFTNPNLYDDFWKYTVLLLNFEASQSGNRLWYEDKSDLASPVVTTALNKAIDEYTYGIQEYVADFDTASKSITINPNTPITLAGDFTLEFYIKYPLDTDFISSTALEHTYFSNGSDFYIKYKGAMTSTQTTVFEIKIGSNVYTYTNAYNYFNYRNNRYNHIALTRLGTQTYFFFDGVLQNNGATNLDSPASSFVINTNTLIQLKGLLNSLRLTKGIARYISNFSVPSMRFGLVGGATDIIGSQVFDTYRQLNKQVKHLIFC